MNSKPAVKLLGEDGNAFVLLGKSIQALEEAGYSQEEIDRFTKQATGGDYNHLLGTVMEWLEVV